MNDFVQVNVISHSKNSLGSCYEHNVDRQKDGEDLSHLLQESNCLGNETITFSHIVVSCGTFEENLRNFYAQRTKSNNYQDLKSNFNYLENLRLEQLKNENREDYQTKHIIEFEVGISEEKAKEYLSLGIDINEGFKQYINDLKDKFGMNTLQMSIHKDEGYIDKDNVLHHNFHGHFLVHNYNFETKKAILSNFRKKDYRQLQTLAQKSFNQVGLDFRRGLSKFQTKLNHQKRNDFTLLMNKIKDKFDFFEKLPILFIAAGPSFDESLEWIKINQNKFFIVTVGAAYKKLLDNNIKIDMITTLDESLILEKLQFDDESISKINKDTIILASMKTDLNILKKFDKNNTFLYELTVPFYKGNIKFDGFSVGEVTLDILLKMNAKEIYLIGLDLALNEDSGTSHSINSSSITFKYDLTKEQKKEQFHVKSLIKIKGNLKKEIFSTSYFYNSIKTIEQILGNINENIKIYNLSSLGAYLSNTIPLNIKDLKIECFRNLQYDNISNYLDKFVLTELDKESKLDLNSDITVIKNILCNDLKKLEDMKIKRYEEFYKEVTRLYLSCKVNNNLIIEIMKKYLMMLFPYLSYHFNNAELKNEKEKINKVRNIFVKQLKNILEDYVICLERISK